MKDPLLLNINIPIGKGQSSYSKKQIPKRLYTQEFGNAYLSAIEREFDCYASDISSFSLKAIRLNSGLLGAFSAKEIAATLTRIVARIPGSDCPEISVRAMPGTINEAAVESYLNSGINKIEFEIGSFDAFEYTMLGYSVSLKETMRVLQLFEQYKINPGVVLFYGIPGQTPESIRCSVAHGISLGVSSIRLNRLHIYKGTPLYQSMAIKNSLFGESKRGRRIPRKDDLQKCVSAAEKELLAAGYIDYNPFCFCKERSDCLVYDNFALDNNFITLGCSGASAIDGVVSINTSNPKRYMSHAGDAMGRIDRSYKFSQLNVVMGG